MNNETGAETNRWLAIPLRRDFDDEDLSRPRRRRRCAYRNAGACRPTSWGPPRQWPPSRLEPSVAHVRQVASRPVCPLVEACPPRDVEHRLPLRSALRIHVVPYPAAYVRAAVRL